MKGIFPCRDIPEGKKRDIMLRFDVAKIPEGIGGIAVYKAMQELYGLIEATTSKEYSDDLILRILTTDFDHTQPRAPWTDIHNMVFRALLKGEHF